MSDEPPPLPSTPEQKAATDAAQPLLAPTSAHRLRATAAKTKELALSLAVRSKAAAQIVANRAERTKLLSITLPTAYRDLGSHVHGAGGFREDFADIYGRIDTLLAEIAKLTAKGSTVDGFAEKAKAVAKAAKDKTHAHALQLKVSHEYAELGKAAFEKHGENSGPANVAKPILNCRALLEALAAQIAEVSKSEPGTFLTPKGIAVGGLAIAVFLLLLIVKMLFLPSSTDERQMTKNDVAETGQPEAPVADTEHEMAESKDRQQRMGGGGSDDRQATKNDVAATRRPSSTQNARTPAAPVPAPTTANSGAKEAAYYHNRGVHWANKGEHDKAIADFNQALRLKPDYASAYKHRGDAWTEKREFDKAIEEALRLKPDDASGYVLRGLAWSVKEDYDAAIADFNESLRLKPDYAHAYMVRGLAWSEKKDYDAAIADFDQALRLKPDCAPAYMGRGRAWNVKGEYDKAVKDYDEALRLDPRNYQAYGNLAYLQATCPDEQYRDGKEAVVNASKACRLTNEKDCWCITVLAAAYAESGQFDKAVESQIKAAEIAPEKEREKLRSILEFYKQGRPCRTARSSEYLRRRLQEGLKNAMVAGLSEEMKMRACAQYQYFLKQIDAGKDPRSSMQDLMMADPESVYVLRTFFPVFLPD